MTNASTVGSDKSSPNMKSSDSALGSGRAASSSSPEVMEMNVDIASMGVGGSGGGGGTGGSAIKIDSPPSTANAPNSSTAHGSNNHPFHLLLHHHRVNLYLLLQNLLPRLKMTIKR